MAITKQPRRLPGGWPSTPRSTVFGGQWSTRARRSAWFRGGGATVDGSTSCSLLEALRAKVGRRADDRADPSGLAGPPTRMQVAPSVRPAPFVRPPDRVQSARRVDAKVERVASQPDAERAYDRKMSRGGPRHRRRHHLWKGAKCRHLSHDRSVMLCKHSTCGPIGDVSIGWTCSMMIVVILGLRSYVCIE